MKRAALALLIAAPAAAQTYEPALIPAQINGAPTDMTPLQLGDDSTAQVDLGFDFTYWGQTFSSAWVSSNGFVSFQSAAHLCCNGVPVEQAQRNTIYGFWTDLVSYSGNPYYKRGEGSILFGWYGTAEYGTQNKETFEIGLFDDGKIQFNFGSLGLSYHSATAGITGPTQEDNIQLFYGSNPTYLQNQSGILHWIAPEPETKVDCTVTPLEPSCPPQMVAPVQVITNSTVETIQEAYAADVQADTLELAAMAPEPEQEIASTPVIEIESVTQQVAALEKTAERLTPDQVAALSAPAPEGFNPVFSSYVPMQSSAITSAAVETVASASSPTSTANTLEALGMNNAPVPATTVAQSDQGGGTMSQGQGEVMEAMAASPGFSAYTQVALQDRPNFYAVRDIYRNRRLRDANFEMYRMTQTNDAKWREMVDEQY